MVDEHELKSWPRYFSATLNNSKTFEIRRNDRDFKLGDTLYLREWDEDSSGGNDDQGYTGRELRATVTYILRSTDADLPVPIPDGYCVMGIKRWLGGKGI